MEIISVTKENIENEHICCAISNNRDCQVVSKKGWLSERFDDGLVFLKGNVRGKCFIEYIPAEKAWAPVIAPDFMYIDCLWVSGQYKGHGNSDLLLDACIKDSRSKGKKGLVVLSSKKKMSFLSDPKFLEYKDFQVTDSAEPYYQLYTLFFDDNYNGDKPRFNNNAKECKEDGNDGFVIYWSRQCPFTAKYVPLLEKVAQNRGVPIKTVLFENAQQAQNSPPIFTAFSLFYQGKFITHEIQSENKFEKMIDEMC